MEGSLARLDAEMLLLARRIESAARHSTMYDRMDRAAYVIARTLQTNGPSSVHELARTLSLDGSTVTRQVAAMEARRQATRRVHPDDGRAWVISLTASGRDEMEAISRARHQRFTEWLADWKPDDVDRFSLLLQQFNASLAETALDQARPREQRSAIAPECGARRATDTDQSSRSSGDGP